MIAQDHIDPVHGRVRDSQLPSFVTRTHKLNRSDNSDGVARMNRTSHFVLTLHTSHFTLYVSHAMFVVFINPSLLQSTLSIASKIRHRTA